MNAHARADNIIKDILVNHLPRIVDGLQRGYVDENQILVIYDHAVRARILIEQADANEPPFDSKVPNTNVRPTTINHTTTMPTPEQREQMNQAVDTTHETLKKFGQGMQELIAKETKPPMPLDQQIIADKQLRVQLDKALQELKALPASRERALAITHLEDVIMRLGLDLKRLGELKPKEAGDESKTLKQCAEEAYLRYGAVTDFKNYLGAPMPDFEALPEKIQNAWMAAVHFAVPTVTAPTRPYPNSYDPSNTKVDPTADGLKL